MASHKPIPTRRRRVGRVFVLFLVALALLGCTKQDRNAGSKPGKLTVGVLPDESAEAIRSRHQPMLDYLAAETGIPLELSIPADYETFYESVLGGKFDLMYFGGFTFVQANRNAGVVPVAMRDVDAKFTSYFLVRAGDPSDSPADLKGRRLAFGSRQSTSGHLMPRHFLLAEGIDPERDFSEVHYSGSHDRTARMVVSGEADLGVANAQVIDRMFADGRLHRQEIRILRETPPYADYVWAVAQGMSKEVRGQIAEAFLALSPANTVHGEILQRQSAGVFLPAAVDDFEPIAQVAVKLGLLTPSR